MIWVHIVTSNVDNAEVNRENDKKQSTKKSHVTPVSHLTQSSQVSQMMSQAAQFSSQNINNPSIIYNKKSQENVIPEVFSTVTDKNEENEVNRDGVKINSIKQVSQMSQKSQLFQNQFTIPLNPVDILKPRSDRSWISNNDNTEIFNNVPITVTQIKQESERTIPSQNSSHISNIEVNKIEINNDVDVEFGVKAENSVYGTPNKGRFNKNQPKSQESKKQPKINDIKYIDDLEAAEINKTDRGGHTNELTPLNSNKNISNSNKNKNSKSNSSNLASGKIKTNILNQNDKSWDNEQVSPESEYIQPEFRTNNEISGKSVETSKNFFDNNKGSRFMSENGTDGNQEEVGNYVKKTKFSNIVEQSNPYVTKQSTNTQISLLDDKSFTVADGSPVDPNSKPQSISYSLMLQAICCKKSADKVVKRIQAGLALSYKMMEIENYFDTLSEIDLIKKVLFTEEQNMALSFIKKKDLFPIDKQLPYFMNMKEKEEKVVNYLAQSRAEENLDHCDLIILQNLNKTMYAKIKKKSKRFKRDRDSKICPGGESDIDVTEK